MFFTLNMKRAILQLLFLLTSVVAQGQTKYSQRYADYIDTYKDLAIEQMLRYDIPASITLAQGLLESAAGYSELATRGNNHFGIKCHGWEGRKMYFDDDASDECFRVYAGPRESYEDHSKFLRSGKRYASLFQLSKKDYRGWAKGLKSAGYATNPQYANQLINIIEQYKLYQYDNAKSYNKFITHHEPRAGVDGLSEGYHPIRMCNGNYFLVANAGDTFRSISQEVGVNYWKIAKYNERDKNDVLSKGDIVYLERKRTKADKAFKNLPHIVKAGESMYSIAQKYGIQLKSLYKKNNLSPDYELQVGDILRVY